jgi:hypothetical protein
MDFTVLQKELDNAVRLSRDQQQIVRLISTIEQSPLALLRPQSKRILKERDRVIAIEVRQALDHLLKVNGCK